MLLVTYKFRVSLFHVQAQHINFIISHDLLADAMLEKRRSPIDREISLVYKRCNTFDVPFNGSDIVFLHAHTLAVVKCACAASIKSLSSGKA